MKYLPRRKFLSISAAGIPLFLTNTTALLSQTKKEKGPALDPALVKDFVAIAHKDTTKTIAMLDTNPDLLNAVHNLGGWDWEDALGAAGHVGNTELATALIDRGARMTICVAAMLGKIQIVRPMIEAFPAMKKAVGPHNISIFRHAKAGGDNAREVLDYLVEIGVKE